MLQGYVGMFAVFMPLTDEVQHQQAFIEAGGAGFRVLGGDSLGC
jgi:hypothetical protein